MAKYLKIGAPCLVKASSPMTYETGLLRGNTGMYISNTRTSRKQASDDEAILIEHFEDDLLLDLKPEA